MLGDERRVPAHRRLPAVIMRLCRREAFGNKIRRMVEDRRQAALGQVSALFCTEAEAASERRPGEARKDEIEICHNFQSGSLDAVCQRR